jgi:hypothetical protein
MPQTILGENAITIPVGTTAQRPTPATGMVRFNTSNTIVEVYNGTSWVSVGGGMQYNAITIDSSGNLINNFFTTADATGSSPTNSILEIITGTIAFSINANGNLTYTY